MSIQPQPTITPEPLDSGSLNTQLVKNVLQNIIGTIGPPDTSTTESVPKEDQSFSDKTVENDNSEQTNSKVSRELKILLALSKEANLDTNICYKRRSLDYNKLKSSPTKNVSSADHDLKRIVKTAFEGNSNFPVTAEAELEQEMIVDDFKTAVDYSKLLKKKRDSYSEVNIGGATEDIKKNRTPSSEIKMFKPNKDMFCWRCHRDGVNISCETCPRSYHQKCLKQTISNSDHWPCPECVSILKAESTQTRSDAMKEMTLERLCSLLKFGLNRMIQCQGSEPFLHPVSDTEFPEYKHYIIQPMDLTKIEKNIKENLYGSTQAFEADAKWLLHNSIIFNSYQSKLTTAAKSIIKVCKQEMMEIENCPSCYLNANTKKVTWFVEVCPKPHLLVWAKLKGFPYWPAKVMCSSPNGNVDVRFFGAHDRAWVHYKECYLFSEKDPNTFKQKRYDIEKCIEELNIYIRNLKKVYGEVRYAPFKTQLDPSNERKQLQIFLPKYKLQKVYPSKKRVNSVDDKSHENNLTTGPELEDSENNMTPEIDVANKVDSADEIKDEVQMEELNETKLTDCTDLNVKSPAVEVNEDIMMEGYGTDDDSVSEINLERRKILNGKSSDGNVEKKCNDEDDNDDEEDDTQIPSNISVDNSLLRGNVRTRGGINTTPGKLKILPRRSSEIVRSKRRSVDEVASPQKICRRNSDQSARSDFNISDKINRVDITESMEISLGNEDGSCVSISENVSSSNGESSRSSVDLNFENKKKPVQVDIDNAEFTISPTNKLKISDKLMKRLSDVSDKSKIEESKKCLVGEKKSQTDLLIEKFKDVVDHKVIDFSEESNENVKEVEHEVGNEINTNIDDNSSINNIANANKIAEFCSSRKDIIDSSLHNINLSPKDNICLSPKDNNESHSVNNVVNETKKSSNKKDSVSNNIFTLPSEQRNSENDEITSPEKCTNGKVGTADVNDKSGEIQDTEKENFVTTEKPESVIAPKKQKLMIQPSIKEYTMPHSIKSTQQTSKDIVESAESPQKDLSETNKEHKNLSPEIVNIVEEFEEEENDKIDEIQIDKINIFNIIHSSLNATKEKNATVITSNDHKELSKDSEESMNKEEIDFKENNLDTNRTESDNVISDRDCPSKSTKEHTSQMAVIDDIQNDTHEGDVLKSNLPPIVKTNSTNDNCKANYVGKKRKHSSGNINSNKCSRLLPVQSMENNEKSVTEKGKKVNHRTLLSNPSPICSSRTSRQSSLQELTTDEIKSEPESDDHFSETENLEAKKKYLSALNISEKVLDYTKMEKSNEIRTRSKAEEKREKFRVVDNLTRIIDDVALNYSASHQGQNIPLRKIERRKSSAVIHEGEISVKSFAKLQDSTTTQQRARKSFPMPTYSKSTSKVATTSTKKDSTPTAITVAKSTSSTILTQSTPCTITNTLKSYPFGKITSTNSINLTTSTVTQVASQPLDNLASSGMSHVILFPSTPGLSYGSPLVNTVFTAMPSLISATTASPQAQQIQPLVQRQPVVQVQQPLATQVQQSPHVKLQQSVIQQPSLLKSSLAIANTQSSQNYVPQREDATDQSAKQSSSNNLLLNELLNQPLTNSTRETETTEASDVAASNANSIINVSSTAQDSTLEDEFAVLNSLVPENVSRAVSELLLRPPPRLKPRPPGLLNNVYDEGVPSSAGTVTARINSISHRMGDYFRGMLIETLEDLGKASHPEAKITSLQMEIEGIKHRHNLQLAEIRKNVCTILKDIQRSITEEREKVIEETRSACEAETIKRVELAKSKQWCANCSKEAQFYCCWNTSYCDYPCQQKHWPQHMGKCTQNMEKTNNCSTPPNRVTGQPLILRPTAPPKQGMGRVISKPTKLYMNRPQVPAKTFKTISSGGNHITVIETTPGNYELVGNGPLTVAGKIFTTTANVYQQKFKTNILSVSSPSTSYSTDQKTTTRTTTATTEMIKTPPLSNTLKSSVNVPIATAEEDS